MDFILASGSPRRLALLQQIGLHPRVVVSHAEEEKKDLSPRHLVLHNALLKERDVRLRCGDASCIIAADTVVSLDDRILGKPGTAEKAADMLWMLSGRTHEVITGAVLSYRGKEAARAVITRVTLKKLTEREIDWYVKTGEPMDKAGAYGIQGRAALFIPHIEGSYSNVVGLPLEILPQLLTELDVIADDALFDQGNAAGGTAP